jgi:FkbM family methyltransferase
MNLRFNSQGDNQRKSDTIDRLLSVVEMRSPVLLKIDVQGYEDRFIKSTAEVLKKIDYVILELSLKQLYEGELSFMEML